MEGIDSSDDASKTGAAASTSAPQSNADQSKSSNVHVFPEAKVTGHVGTSVNNQATNVEGASTSPANAVKIQVQERIENSPVDQASRTQTTSPIFQPASEPSGKAPEAVKQDDRSNTIKPVQPLDAGNSYTAFDIELKGGPKATVQSPTEEKETTQQERIYYPAYGNPWSAEIDDGPNSFGVRTMWTDKLPNLPTKAKKAKKKKEKVVPTPTKEIEPTKLTTEIAKKVVESVLFDGEVKKRMERRGGWLFSHVPGGVAGTLKNLSVFPVEVVEQIFPSVDFGAHQDDCNGLAELAYGKVKDDPDLADYKFDLASRLNSINADHEGLELRIKGKIYILDWHQTLEPENPLIFNAKDWFVADDSKGIPYKDFLQGAELP